MVSLRPRNEKFPVKSRDTREFAWRLVRSALRRQPTLGPTNQALREFGRFSFRTVVTPPFRMPVCDPFGIVHKALEASLTGHPPPGGADFQNQRKGRVTRACTHKCADRMSAFRGKADNICSQDVRLIMCALGGHGPTSFEWVT